MADKYAEYKGKTYRLVWQGTTKYGPRAKLAFKNGSKEFWVDSNLIKETETVPTQQTGFRNGKHWGACWECGCEGWLDSDGYCGC
jgi:hypothetical protein